MRSMFKKAAILGGLSVSLLSTSAFAGGCVPGPAGPICAPNVIAHPSAGSAIDPMHVFAERPMGHLRSVQYLGTPSVNITRVHGMAGGPSLSDAPSGFTGGCTPESTHYCGARAAAPMPAPMIAQPAPIMSAPAPVMAAPAPYISAPAPVIAAPAPQLTERVVAVGGGYDPSKFTPRTYGSNELTPGIAHIPTSVIDRSHSNATAVLNGGMTQPQAIASGGTVPMPTMSSNVIGTMSNTVSMAPQTNVYPGSMASDGTYYEKVSGPTMLGGMQATQVICKRQAPQMHVQSPIVGVPTPVPTPVCQSVPAQMPMAAPMAAPVAAPQQRVPFYAPASSGRYGSSLPGSRFGSGATRYGH